MNVLGMEVGATARAKIDAAAAAAAASEPEAPQEEPTQGEPEAPQEEPAQEETVGGTEVNTEEVSGDGAIGAVTGGQVSQQHTHVAGNQVFLRIEASEAADDLREIFSSASNQESQEVRVGDLVAPPGAEAHFTALEEEHLLVLASTRRTGLTTAAELRCKAFAEEHRLPAKQLLSTSIEELGKELRNIKEPTVLVLDASQNPDLEASLAARAKDLHDRVHRQECHLVLAVEIEFRHAFKSRFPNTVFDLDRTDPVRVFTRHFDRPEAEFTDILASEYFADTLSTAWPPLARSMAETLNGAPAGMSEDEFRERLGQLLGNASETIRDLLEQQLDPMGKAVLIAAAALEQLPASAIAQAADALLEASRTEDDTGELFDKLGIDQKLELIRRDFNLDGSNFKNPDMGDEVLLHVWQQYPAWREPLLRWLTDLLLGPEYLAWTEFTRLPRRLVMLDSATGSGSLLTEHVETMLASRSAAIWSFAPVVMLGGALDPVLGPSVRNRLYEWSRSTDFSKQKTALAACSDKDYLVRYPSNALFRLRRLSKSTFADIRESASDAIVDSAGYLHLSDLLVHFHFWLIGYDRSAGETDDSEIPDVARILDRICDKPEIVAGIREEPSRLLDDPIGVVASFWRLLFSLADPASFRMAARAWLTTAAELDGPDGDRMTALLVDAAAGDYAAIGQVAQAAKSLALEGSDLSDRTRELSLHMLNRVFEIEVPLP